MSERGYSPVNSYSQSKLAMLIFAPELQRRSDRNHWRLLLVATHPGVARTDLTKGSRGSWHCASIGPATCTSRCLLRSPTLSVATDPAVVLGGV
jgi:hypothetical protein